MESLGKEFHFVKEPPQDHFCPACTELLTEPFLTDCCGQHVCRTCRGRLLASGKTECPVCCEPNVLDDARLNKHLQRLVNDLKVHCKYHEEGCKWEGELRNLQEHLDPLRRRCSYVLIPCRFGCGDLVRSGAVKEHKKSHCHKRPSTCEHCGYHNTHDIVKEKHYPVCRQFPVDCPNKCQAKGLKQCQLQAHRDVCPLQVIACPFSGAGCTVQLPRREMETHEEKDMRQHLLLVMKLVEPKQEEAITLPSATGCLPYIFNSPPVEFTMTDYLRMIEPGEKWTSPPFYTHPQGYKMCLEVVPNGIGAGNGTHVSVFACLMRGEHDEQLEWPFEGDTVIELLNWKEDKGHLEKTVSLHELNSDLTEGGFRKSHAYHRFIPHSSLSYNPTNKTEYLEDDCLRLRVKTVALYSTPVICKTPAWQDPLIATQSLCEFTMTDFCKRKQFNNICYSPPFYTHPRGYKVCLDVVANGDGSGKGTHVSVNAYLMRGEHDDQLQWPFEGDVIIKLLNWRDDKEHRGKTLTLNSLHGFQTETAIRATAGCSQFTPHSSLSYNPATNTEYLQDDCLRLRVTMTLYFAPLLPKTPAWQHTLASSKSLCEFTVTEFSKRRQFNNQYFSPPFYTHSQGYKMSLKVYANGTGRGKGTHVSVFVYLMRGEHDNQLQWPFEGDVPIELLNWRENKGHHKKTFTVDKNMKFIRVTDAEFGENWGYHQFISHFFLSYNPTTEYLQDDCLRLRVTAITPHK